MKIIILPALALALLASCAEPTKHASSRTLRARSIHTTTYLASRSREPRLNYPRPGELRNYGEVQVASSAYTHRSTTAANTLPPIAEYAPSENGPAEAVPFEDSSAMAGAVTGTLESSTPAYNAVTERYRARTLGPAGTNRAVINQITGLPVDQ